MMAKLPPVKLSPAMVALLRKLATSGARLVLWRLFPSSYAKLPGEIPVAVLSATTEALVKRGLVREMMRDHRLVVYIISDTGLDHLGLPTSSERRRSHRSRTVPLDTGDVAS